MAEELKITKEKTEIHLTTVGGAGLSGHVFVQPYNPIRGGRERPADIMNSPEPYFPLQTDGGFVLIAKANILEVDYDSDEESRDGLLPMDVTVSLTGGQMYDGIVWVEGPVNTPRLQDFMNRPGRDKFLTLQSDGKVRLLNRACIETIRSHT